MSRDGSREKSTARKTLQPVRPLNDARAQSAQRKGSAASAKTHTPTVAVIGAGRLGTALALALAARGYHVKALAAQRKSHARRAAALFKHAPPVALAAHELAALPRTDLLLISTPDDQLAATAARLTEIDQIKHGHTHTRGDARKRVRVALHTSGALSSAVLAELRARGFAVGSLHPLISVSDARAGARSLHGAFYCVEGDARAVRAARKLVRALGGHSFSIRAEDKALYHAAAVLASGHTVALFDLATELLRACGIAPRAARRALKPLTQSTLTNLMAARTPAQALTGPFARGDVATVRKSIVALAALARPVPLCVYALLGYQALRLAPTTGTPAADEIEAVLNSVPARVRS